MTALLDPRAARIAHLRHGDPARFSKSPKEDLAESAKTRAEAAKIFGMFGSDHIGERAAAAQMADRLVKESGLTWFQVISPQLAISSGTVAEKIAFALRNIGALSMWERGFIYSVNGKQRLSDKQLAVLDQIVAKAQAFAEVA